MSEIFIPVTPAARRAAKALVRHRIATGRVVPQDLLDIALAPDHEETIVDYDTYRFVTAPGGAVVEHSTCVETVCEIEEGDSLATILAMVKTHLETCTAARP